MTPIELAGIVKRLLKVLGTGIEVLWTEHLDPPGCRDANRPLYWEGKAGYRKRIITVAFCKRLQAPTQIGYLNEWRRRINATRLCWRLSRVPFAIR